MTQQELKKGQRFECSVCGGLLGIVDDAGCLQAKSRHAPEEILLKTGYICCNWLKNKTTQEYCTAKYKISNPKQGLLIAEMIRR